MTIENKIRDVLDELCGDCCRNIDGECRGGEEDENCGGCCSSTILAHVYHDEETKQRWDGIVARGGLTGRGTRR